MKSWSPIQYLTRLSHEELNPYHRLLGRILISFFALHASLYLNFYVQKGLLSKRIRDSDVILGLSGITTFLILGTAALSKVRDYSYRVFFVSHVFLSIVLLPILYFHVSHLRVYILESAAVYIVLILQRNLSSTLVQATLTRLPQTSLLSLSLPLTRPLSKRTYYPGQHIYLSLPTSPSTPLNKLRLNPFTIANLPSHEPHIHLIIRALSGTTHLLSTLPPSPSLLIEGPYGSAPQFPNLVEKYDRILLVAGGVGATFTLPIYRNILQHLRSISSTITTTTAHKIRFVWTVRAAADASWGLKQLHEDGEDAAPGFELYISGSSRATPRPTESDASIELEEREGLLGGDETDVAGAHATVPRRGRPDLKAVVDERFGHDAHENVAVLVCGPRGMGKALRKEVGRWVKRGREVFWHEEGFGW